jgi:IS30 family transposase
MKPRPEDSCGQRTQRKARKLDRKKVVELRTKNLSVEEIAKHQGVAPSTVWRFLQRTAPERQALETFKSNRADELANLQGKAMDVQHRVLDCIAADLQDEAIAGALSPSQKTQYLNAAAMVGGISFDKERLERGESTSNVSLVSRMIDASVSTLYKRNADRGASKTGPKKELAHVPSTR